MIADIKRVCRGRVKSIVQGAKESQLISTSDLESLEQISRILKNLETVTDHESVPARINLSTEELTDLVRRSKHASASK
jgi:hypothetical protein